MATSCVPGRNCPYPESVIRTLGKSLSIVTVRGAMPDPLGSTAEADEILRRGTHRVPTQGDILGGSIRSSV